jgi:cell wall assembly regulator SMI1
MVLLLPIARDAGGNQFCLDLSDVIPFVWVYPYDENGEQIKVANNFEEFLCRFNN